MASTRRIQIYEDPSTEASSQQSSTDEHQAHTILLQPSTIPASNTRSPLKPSQSNSAPLKPIFGNPKKVFLPHRRDTNYDNTDSLTKQPQPPRYHTIAQSNSEDAAFGQLPASHSYDQENRPPLHQAHHSDNYAEFPDPASAFKPPSKPPIIKRFASKPAPRQTRSPKAAESETSTQSHLPLPEELPPLVDNHKKPPYSYCRLIGMAILRAKDRQLTLDQLYTWIAETFSFYRLEDGGWKNSIRHNLSIHKEFQKKERSKNDPGKGNYWIIQPGMEEEFYKEKPSRRSASAGGPTMKTFSQPLNQPSLEVWSLPAKVGPKSVPQAAPSLEQPSSDATIPASDPVSPEHRIQDAGDMPPPAPRIQLSSPYLGIASSPPVELHDELGEDPPQPALDVSLPPAQPRTRKRNSAAMDDSGYFSSIESSATRRLGTAQGLQDVEEDRPRLKRGRAEEEIARMRSSSHDASPSKGRTLLKPATPQLVSSSPLRFDIPQLQLELTPMVTLTIPPKPPASVSPGTTLRDHRNQMHKLLFDSPFRNLATLPEDVPFSPQFDHLIGDELSGYNNEFQTGFDMFDDMNGFVYPDLFSASPEKGSTRRSRLARPGKTINALSDITNTQQNRKLLAPAHKAPYLESPIRPSSAKSRRSGEIRDDVAQEDFFNHQFLADDDGDQGDYDGIDLSQGFQKIGRKQISTPKFKKLTRPHLGARSQTSRI